MSMQNLDQWILDHLMLRLSFILLLVLLIPSIASANRVIFDCKYKPDSFWIVPPENIFTIVETVKDINSQSSCIYITRQNNQMILPQ